MNKIDENQDDSIVYKSPWWLCILQRDPNILHILTVVKKIIDMLYHTIFIFIALFIIILCLCIIILYNYIV